MALITPAQLREHFSAITGSASDVQLAAVIARADQLLAQACGYPVPDSGEKTLEQAAYTLYLDGPDLDAPYRLSLPVWPAQVTAVSQAADWDYATVNAGEYRVTEPTGKIDLKPTSTVSWLRARQAIKVAYTAGFATTPEALVAITAHQTIHMLRLGGVQGFTAATMRGQSLTRDGESVYYPGAMKALASDYRVGAFCG